MVYEPVAQDCEGEERGECRPTVRQTCDIRSRGRLRELVRDWLNTDNKIVVHTRGSECLVTGRHKRLWQISKFKRE